MSVKLTNSKSTDYHIVKMMRMRMMNQNQKHDVRENDDNDDVDYDEGRYPVTMMRMRNLHQTFQAVMRG